MTIDTNQQTEGAFYFSSIFKKELEVVKQQRANRKDTKKDEQLIGLAISGGGIRSSSFALGVLQSLNEHQKLQNVDYLSTVSGGGYIGASLTWFNYLNKKASPEWRFPFAIGKGVRSASEDDKKDKQVLALDYLIQHGNYLFPSDEVTPISLVGVILRNVTLAMSVYLAGIVGLMLLVFQLFEPAAWILPFTESWPRASWFFQLFVMVILLFGGTTFLYAVLTYFEVVATKEFGYRFRVFFQYVQGKLIIFVIALGLMSLLPIFHQWLMGAMKNTSYLASSLPALMGIIGAVYEFFEKEKGKKDSKGILAEVRIIITSLFLIVGILMIGYKIALDIHTSPNSAIFYVLVGAILLFGILVNLNLFGIGRMDRDRLMETFLPNEDAIRKNKWDLATQADASEGFFKDIAGQNQWGPYHLVNTNVVLVDSKQAKFRGRGGDNFILSPCFCGSDAIGFYDMAELEKGELTLATAMAISGAALNPNTANSGQGVTRNRLISFILSFLNIRLGFWIRNPSAKGFRKPIAKYFGPNFFYPGLIQGLLGQELNEEAGYLELTDGGHYDNTGLYELIRRRVDVIYYSSAGADPEFTLDDLGSVLVRINVDFGVTIEFKDSLETLMPSATSTKNYLEQLLEGSQISASYWDRFSFSKTGFAIGKINYPESPLGPAKIGHICMVRATLVKDLPAQIYSYKAQHGEFPNQSTVDQFFEEIQLEAYRELGLKLTDQLCKDKDCP